jgi:hypothetical protein
VHIFLKGAAVRIEEVALNGEAEESAGMDLISALA